MNDAYLFPQKYSFDSSRCTLTIKPIGISTICDPVLFDNRPLEGGMHMEISEGKWILVFDEVFYGEISDSPELNEYLDGLVVTHE